MAELNSGASGRDVRILDMEGKITIGEGSVAITQRRLRLLEKAKEILSIWPRSVTSIKRHR